LEGVRETPPDVPRRDHDRQRHEYERDHPPRKEVQDEQKRQCADREPALRLQIEIREDHDQERQKTDHDRYRQPKRTFAVAIGGVAEALHHATATLASACRSFMSISSTLAASAAMS